MQRSAQSRSSSASEWPALPTLSPPARVESQSTATLNSINSCASCFGEDDVFSVHLARKVALRLALPHLIPPPWNLFRIGSQCYTLASPSRGKSLTVGIDTQKKDSRAAMRRCRLN